MIPGLRAVLVRCGACAFPGEERGGGGEGGGEEGMVM